MATNSMIGPSEPARPPGISRRWLSGGRRLAVGIAVGLAVFLGIAVWQIRSLEGLPDVGDPFDVSESLQLVDLPDDQNAYVVYATAHPGRFQFPKGLTTVDFKALTWSKAGPEVRSFVEQKRPALDQWRLGSERPDALYHQPQQFAMDTGLPLIQDMRSLAVLAGLEGSRFEEVGAMGQAWDWYRALLRFSRHAGRHGCLIERLVGAAVHDDATSRILHWAADPRVDVEQLRHALDDTLAADALTPPLSEALKVEYLMALRDLDELRVMVTDAALPGGKYGMLDQMVSKTGLAIPARRAWLRASNDVTRSRRAIRLLFANWLAQVDRPAAQRASAAIQKPVWIYATDPTAPPAARAVAPEVLAKAVEHNALTRTNFDVDEIGYHPYRPPLWEENGPLARERRNRSVLIVRLAAELYRREHGQLPAQAGALVGPYLKDLPEGIAPGDPIPSATEGEKP
jgi:hypothetical protein